MSKGFEKLVAVMARLRGEGGCPWDREQTPKTLKTYLLEETYETLEAIDGGDPAKLREELGDLLLQVVFLSQIATERGEFDVDEVAAGISEKLIRRHPHVFGGESAADAREAIGRWEEIKNEERRVSGDGSVLSGVPTALPALLRAHRIADKASMVGFDWASAEEVLGKVEEEIAELREALAARDQAAAEEELGDLLFAVASAARHAGVDPEMALQSANRKFTDRFRRVEERLLLRGLRPSKELRDEMERLWASVKDQTDST